MSWAFVEELFTNKLVTLGPYTFLNNLVLGRGGLASSFVVFFFFFSCSYCVPIKLPKDPQQVLKGSQCSHCVPNSTTLLCTCFWPKLNFHVYKRGPKGCLCLCWGEYLLFRKNKMVMGKSKWLLPKTTLIRSINIYTHLVRFKWVWVIYGDNHLVINWVPNEHHLHK